MQERAGAEAVVLPSKVAYERKTVGSYVVEQLERHVGKMKRMLYTGNGTSE